MTQDAIYEPLRKCQAAKFFRNTSDGHIVPCAPSDEGAIKMTIADIVDTQALLPPKVCFEDYIKALQKIKPTVNSEDLRRQEEFTRDFGQEG